MVSQSHINLPDSELLYPSLHSQCVFTNSRLHFSRIHWGRTDYHPQIV